MTRIRKSRVQTNDPSRMLTFTSIAGRQFICMVLGVEATPWGLDMDEPKFDDMTRRVMSYSKFMDLKTFSGVATFFRANLCHDWSEVDVALVGLPTDLGLTQRSGARHGPREIRNQSCNVLYYNPLTKVIPFEMARIADIGDVPLISAFNLANVVAEIHEFYAKLHKAGIVPVTAGGDHSISYPILKALGAGRPVGLVHIDAHIDCTDRIADSTLHHGSPFKNAVLDGVLDPKRTIHIAIRDPAGEFENFAHETGQTVIDIDQFYDHGGQRRCRRGAARRWRRSDLHLVRRGRARPRLRPGNGYACRRGDHHLRGQAAAAGLARAGYHRG